ncbi:MAG: MOSC domain-containing protein [Chloroflexota bacterium]
MSEKGRVVAVCAGERRHEGKHDVHEGYVREDYGLVGDAHAGPGDSQITLVAIEDVERIDREKGIAGGPGDFAANVATRGLDLVSLPPGSQVRVGQALLEVTHIGKDPSLAHSFSFQGVSLLVERGVFCRVLKGGQVKEGDEAEIVSRSA